MARRKTQAVVISLVVTLTLAILAARSWEQERPALNRPAFTYIQANPQDPVPPQPGSGTVSAGTKTSATLPAVVVPLTPLPHPTGIKPVEWIILQAQQSSVIQFNPLPGNRRITLNLQAYSLQTTIQSESGQVPRASADLIPAGNIVALSQERVNLGDKAQKVTITSRQKSPGVHLIIVVASGKVGNQTMQATAAFVLTK